MLSKSASSSSIISRRASSSIIAANNKDLWIIRHGQAMHNPRAEAARAAGCSFDEFLELMRQDDALDADLTTLGERQAVAAQSLIVDPSSSLDLIVSSPLSRAIRTANLVVDPVMYSGINRVVMEDFREINGWLLNGKRRNVKELTEKFPAWDFSQIAKTDELWTEELEESTKSGERGYTGLSLLMERPETAILLAGHGGSLKYTMENPLVELCDSRTSSSDRPVDARFENCELRRFKMKWKVGTDGEKEYPAKIILEEVDL